jgi:transcription termination factor Rho
MTKQPAAAAAAPDAVRGILEVRGHHGYLRVAGYLISSEDIYVSANQIRQYGLRSGDLITGVASLEPRGRRDKQTPLTQLDTVNGAAPGPARPDFYDLIPVHPQHRLRLETEPHVLTTRVMDLLTPIGRGQRALIVSPPKAGKTTVLQAIAAAVARNHPDVHLMAVLIDERPEEVTDMQRTVRGEVIASPFDRPPTDHVAAAELSIERAKRLVELGQHVVVLLDSITRLARAYNLAAPSGGRTLSGGIDASALHLPKRLLGAARNIEGGGSLTIIATAMVETGSGGDTLFFEEFKSTGNCELRLLRASADRRIFPAVDVSASGTRKEELLFDADELALVRRLRKALQNGDSQVSVENLLDGLRKTGSNAEFLLQLARV